MNKARLKEFAKHVTQNGIKKEEAKETIRLLSTKDLQVFMRFLSLELEKKTVHITTSEETDHETDKQLKNVFENINIIKTVDPKIGGGINARVYDMIYDLSVKSSIERLAQAAQEEI